MLQEPEEGGKLRVYNKTWEEAKKYNDRNNTLISEDGKEISLDDSSEIEKVELGLEAGNLLIFQGGRLWHRVEKVLGNKERVTLGGFLGFGKDETDNNVYLWA